MVTVPVVREITTMGEMKDVIKMITGSTFKAAWATVIMAATQERTIKSNIREMSKEILVVAWIVYFLITIIDHIPFRIRFPMGTNFAAA